MGPEGDEVGDKGAALPRGECPAGTVCPQGPGAAAKTGRGQPMKTEEPRGCRLGLACGRRKRGEGRGPSQDLGSGVTKEPMGDNSGQQPCAFGPPDSSGPGSAQLPSEYGLSPAPDESNSQCLCRA